MKLFLNQEGTYLDFLTESFNVIYGFFFLKRKYFLLTFDAIEIQLIKWNFYRA
jgi:hypothetical protein